MRIPPIHPRRFVFPPLFRIGNTVAGEHRRTRQRSENVPYGSSEGVGASVLRGRSSEPLPFDPSTRRSSANARASVEKNRGRRKKQGEDGKKERKRGKEARSRAGFVATPKPGCGWCWCWCCCSLLGETSRKLYTHTLPVCPLIRIRIPIQIFAHTPPETPTLRTDTVASSHMLTVKGGNERSSRTYAHAHLHASWKMSITKNHCSFALSSCPSLFLAIFLVRLLARRLARSLAPRFVRSMVRARTIASTHFHRVLRIPFPSISFPFFARDQTSFRKNRLVAARGRIDDFLRCAEPRSMSRFSAFVSWTLYRILCLSDPKILPAAYYQTRFTADFLANTTPRWIASFFFFSNRCIGRRRESANPARNAYRRASSSPSFTSRRSNGSDSMAFRD